MSGVIVVLKRDSLREVLEICHMYDHASHLDSAQNGHEKAWP
jgi:hypothetical protein